RWQYVKEMFRLIERSGQGLAASDPTRMRRRNVQAATIAAIRRYQPRYFDGRVHLFLPNTEWRRSHHDALRWKSLARDCDASCGPDGYEGDLILAAPYVDGTAERFMQCRDRDTMEEPSQIG